MIIGTAGHIDHGKTALVRALTGVDTDRLPEEKRRGITIDLGFAPLDLPGVGRAGVVDVPGHEAFVRTMLAGATGIDLALLVIASDEGVMPQTREHLAILGLLGIRGGVVALTKCDLVDEPWLDLVRADVEEVLQGSSLERAPLVPTSVTTGAGMEDLRLALASAATTLPARDRDDLFRMPIDRVFTMKGTGTVVTGTVWSGELRRDAMVRLLPYDRAARVRGLQAHGEAIDVAGPGTRAAVALAGVDHTEIERGAVVVTDASWRAMLVLRADVALLDHAVGSLAPRTRVRFHLGTTDVGARVVTPGGAIAPGEIKAARIVLDAPVTARGGDRFVLRGGSPLMTIGGGVVVDPLPALKRVRPWVGAHTSPAERLTLMLDEGGTLGVARDTLAVRLGVAPRAIRQLLDEPAVSHVEVGGAVFASAAVAEFQSEIERRVRTFHQEHPLEPGVLTQSVRSQLASGVHGALFDVAMARLSQSGVVETSGSMLRAVGWTPRLTAEQQALRETLERVVRESGTEPPSVGELVTRYGAAVSAVLRILEREGIVVAVEPERFYARDVVEGLLNAMRLAMEAGREYSPAEIRDVLGVSRKYLIPFLEFCDRRGITERRVSGRVLQAR